MLQILLTVFLGLLVIFYLKIRKKMCLFKSEGIAEDPGYFPLGSNSSWKVLTGKIPFIQISDETYLKFPSEKIVGWYGPFGQPVLIVRDMDIAKAILIKDFEHFIDRRQLGVGNKANRYFNDMIVMLTGERWKKMRTILSPAFTSGKLKSMMPLIKQA